MVLIVFVVLAAIGQLLNVALCLALDYFLPSMVSAMVFVGLYMFVFAGAWLLTIRVMESRYAVQYQQQSR